MRIFLSLFIFILLSNAALAQSEEEGVFNLNKNTLEPGKTPVSDERLAPTEDTRGIVLPWENNDLPLEAAIAFSDKKKKSFISRDFVFGFLIGGVLITFAAFFMLKFSKKPLDP